jgi:hypothetical protein
MKKTLALLLVALPGWPEGALAQEFPYRDAPMTEYLQRIEGVTAGAGDAKSHNAAVHAIDPHPALANNRAIPGSGERMSHTIRRYHDVSKLPEAARPIVPEGNVGGASGSGSATSGK